MPRLRESVEQQGVEGARTWLCRVFRCGLQGDAVSAAAAVTPEQRAWSSADPQSAMLLADSFALAGDADEAFEWLEALLRTGAAPFHFLSTHNPFLSRLRSDARWPGYIDRVRDAWERVEITGPSPLDPTWGQA